MSELNTDDYYLGLDDIGVAPLWTSLDQLLPRAPKSPATPFLWRYSDIKPQLLRAGELVSAAEAERRVLMLLSPDAAVAKTGGTTRTLYAGIQLVLPHEVARAHRHVAAAFRFVIEGGGGRAFTTVDGERVSMHPGDLVLTPQMRTHDHGNDSDEAVIWLDGLDLPLVNFLDANFFEPSADRRQATTRPDDVSSHAFTHGRLNPRWEQFSGPSSPLNRYPWAEAEKALYGAMADGADSATDGVIFEYTNPVTGGSVMPTLSCFIQALRPGQRTAAHRHTTSVVYLAVRGGGSTVVDGEELAWEANDVFCVPSWSVHEHVNGSRSEEAVLFSFNNQAAYESLGLYREEPVDRS